MRCSLVIISSYVRMLRTSFAENASHGMGERANAERASSVERATKRNPATTQPGLGVDLRRMNGSGLAASTVRSVDRIVTPPLQRRRNIGRHAGSLEVTVKSLGAFLKTPRGPGARQERTSRRSRF